MIADAEQRKRELARKFHRTFGSEDGKHVLSHLKEVFGYGKSLAVRLKDGQVDSVASHIKEGQQDPLRYIDLFLIENPLDDTEQDPKQPTVKKS